MPRIFSHFLILASMLMLTSCKIRRTKSGTAGLSTLESGLLDLSQVRDPVVLQKLCDADDLVVFIGNGEKFGVVQPNMDVEPSRRLSNDDLLDLQRYDDEKDRWYFGKIKAEYAALLRKMAQENPACAKVANIHPRVQVLSILDGPEIGDSRVEVTTFGRSETGAWQPLEKSNSLQFNGSTLLNAPAGATQELLMPRDVPGIIEAFTKNRQKPFRFALTILKGHGVKMRMRDNDDVSLLNIFYFRTSGLINQYEDIPVTLLDIQDAKGIIIVDKSPVVAPIWSHAAICRLTQPTFEGCVAERRAIARQGFKPSTILGCGRAKFADIAARQGDEKQGDEKQGDEKQGDEKQGDEKQGDEKQGDEKQGLFLQGLGGFNTIGDDLQGSKGVALFRGKEEFYAEKMQRMFPAAVRYLGTGAVLTRVGETHAGDNIPMYSLRVPIEAQTHLVLLDSCSMEMDRINIGRNGSNEVDGVFLVNPFPLSADAIQYDALHLPQYYYLLASIFTDVNNTTRREGPLADLTQRLNDANDKSRRDKLLAALGPFNRGNEKLDAVYCSMYPMPFECSGGHCKLVSKIDEAFNNVCPSKLWQEFDPGCSVPTPTVELKIIQHTVTTLEAIDAGLKILRNRQPIPIDLHGRIWSAMEVEVEGLYGQGHPRHRHFGAMSEEYRFHRLNPMMEQGDFAAPEELLIQERYLVMLKRYLEITHLGSKKPFDPLKFAILGAGKMHLNKLRNSGIVKPTKAIFADFINDFELGSAEQLTAREQFMEFLHDNRVDDGKLLLKAIVDKEKAFVDEMGRQKTFVQGSYAGWTPAPHLVELYRDLLREILRITE